MQLRFLYDKIFSETLGTSTYASNKIATAKMFRNKYTFDNL